jgi:hypothetical protein
MISRFMRASALSSPMRLCPFGLPELRHFVERHSLNGLETRPADMSLHLLKSIALIIALW